MCIRVDINLAKPFRRYLKVTQRGDDIKFSLQYERIPLFSFFCKQMNHVERDCVTKLLNVATMPTALPFGNSLHGVANTSPFYTSKLKTTKTLETSPSSHPSGFTRASTLSSILHTTPLTKSSLPQNPRTQLHVTPNPPHIEKSTTQSVATQPETGGATLNCTTEPHSPSSHKSPSTKTKKPVPLLMNEPTIYDDVNPSPQLPLIQNPSSDPHK